MTLIQARLESLRFVLTSITMAVTRLGLCIYFVAGLKWGIWGVLYSQAIVFVVFGIYLTYRELRIGSIYPDVTKWKEILRFALPLVPNGILAFVYGASAWFFIIRMSPYENTTTAWGAFGIYALAGTIMGATGFMGVGPMQRVWTAEMYDVYKRPDAPYAFGNFILRLLCVQTFAALFIALFGLEIVRVMCGSSYHEAAPLIPLFGLHSILSLLGSQMNNTFFITRKTDYNFFCTLFSLPGMFLFMYLLVPRWGITGAILAHLFASAIYISIVYSFTQRFFFIRYPFGKMAMLLALTISCYGMSLLCGSGVEEFTALSKWDKITNLWDHIQWSSVLAKMGVMLLWCVLIWFSGILLPEDKALIHRVFKRWLKT